MTTSVAQHYSEHLGPIYSWMVGDFESACSASTRYFDEIKLDPRTTRRAIDLGCGHGVQSIPLARRGFHVLAIDNCAQLLDELGSNARGLSIVAVDDDLNNFTAHGSGPVDAIVCMGDTITHLDSPSHVKQLVATAAAMLEPQGVLCLSFRDYVSTELTGVDRVIPVRSDADRIHTCFLEYESTHVNVHDIVHTRSESAWGTSVSAYRKLRLALDKVVGWAVESGLSLSNQTQQRGMHFLEFKPASGKAE